MLTEIRNITQRSLERMQSTTAPMPPKPASPPTAATAMR